MLVCFCLLAAFFMIVFLLQATGVISKLVMSIVLLPVAIVVVILYLREAAK